MPDLGPHASFIVAAYGVTLIAVTAMVLTIVADDRRQRRLLAELERKGVKRRSATPGAPPQSSKPPASPKRKPVRAKPAKPRP